jgi:hypothetical protein
MSAAVERWAELDGDIEQGETSSEDCGQPHWPQVSLQLLEEIVATQQRKFVDADLVGGRFDRGCRGETSSVD